MTESEASENAPAHLSIAETGNRSLNLIRASLSYCRWAC
jgi:hypothetical protein